MLFDRLLNNETDFNLENNRDYKYTDSRNWETSNIAIDSRSSQDDNSFVYAPSIILNSAGATSSTATKKEMSLSPNVSTPVTQNNTPSFSDYETTDKSKISKGTFSFDSTSLIIAGAVVGGIILFGGKK